MIITKDCIFFHIPKTAGKSIVQAYSDSHKIDENIRVHDYDFINNKTTKSAHLKAEEVIQLIGSKAFQKAFKFTVIRNPFDRLVSFYHYGLKKLTKNQFESFEEFVSFVVGEIQKPESGEGWHNARITQSEYIGENHGIKVFKFEELQSEWKWIKTHLSINSIENLPKINKSVHNHYDEYYNKETRLKVFNYFVKDFKYYEA